MLEYTHTHTHSPISHSQLLHPVITNKGEVAGTGEGGRGGGGDARSARSVGGRINSHPMR